MYFYSIYLLFLNISVYLHKRTNSPGKKAP